MSTARSSVSSPRRKRSPAAKVVARKTSASNASAPIEESFAETPPILSVEEKHQLILAHSEARAPRDPLQRLTLWGGVAIAFCALLVGWVFTVGRDIRSHISLSSGDTNALTEKLNAFTDTVQKTSALENRGAVTNPTAEAAAAEFVSSIEALLGATSSSAIRDDLISPSPYTVTSSGTGANRGGGTSTREVQ